MRKILLQTNKWISIKRVSRLPFMQVKGYNEHTANRKLKILKIIVIITILSALNFSLTGRLNASPLSKKEKNRWSVSGSLGIAVIQTEIGRDFTILQHEFSHQPGLAFNLSVGKMLGEHWEPLFNFGNYTLSGVTTRPEFSAMGTDSRFNSLHTDIPVEYDNITSSILFSIRYYFKKFSYTQKTQVGLNPFAELGAGINVFSSKVIYQTVPPNEQNHLIFQKAGENKGNVVQFSLGLGTKINVSNKWELILSLNSDLVDYDCMDAVHNYSLNGDRLHSRTLVTRLMAGISIPFGNSGGISPRPAEKNPSPWSP